MENIICILANDMRKRLTYNMLWSPRVVGRGGLSLGFWGLLDFHPEHLCSPRPPDASNLLVLTFSLDRSLISVYDVDKPFTVQSPHVIS
jgi:hypothetical protein